MNKTPRLSKSGIEYLDYAWNFYSGCLNSERGICPVGENCWAKGITVRFPDRYPNGFDPTFYPEAFLSPLYLKKPSIIGCAFMGDLFGDWVDPQQHISAPLPERPKRLGSFTLQGTLKQVLFGTIRNCPQHTFLFLTKCPQNLPQWSPFPDNCRVGVTATGYRAFNQALDGLKVIKAKVKYISIEPLLEGIIFYPERLSYCGISWVIIGAQTNPYKPPKIEWVEEIETAAKKVGIPIFEKDNLKPLLKRELIQEMPNV